MGKHIIVDTAFGEVMCRQVHDCFTDNDFIECYIGSDFDSYIGCIDATIDDNEKELRYLIEKLL